MVSEIRQWPELTEVFSKAGNVSRPDWELPIRACLSVGGQRSDALAVAASVACLQISIILADDILDDDPRGAHRILGPGRASNMALAFQAASFRLIDFVPIRDKEKCKLRNTLAEAALATASGQHLDVQNLSSEDDYWKVVKAKSTPFYAAALKLGSIAGSGNDQFSEGLFNLGAIIGEIIQLEDDLEDALAVPANADWLQGRNNLLILFARTAPHEDKELFEKLILEVTDPLILIEAQQILIKSGAVSYCAYQLTQRFRLSMDTLDKFLLPNPTPLEEILHAYANSLLALLRVSGIELSLSDLLPPNS